MTTHIDESLQQEIMRQTTDEATLGQRMEDNLAEFWVGYGQTAHGEALKTPTLKRFATTIMHPLFNAAFTPSTANLSADEADVCAAETLAYFRNRRRPSFWWLRKDARLNPLAEAICKRGAQEVGNPPGMLLDMAAQPVSADLPAGFTVVPVTDQQTLRQWTQVVVLSNNMDAALIAPIFECEVQRGFPAGLWRYLGLVDGQPVATSELLCYAGVAGIFSVATLAAHRGKGYGTLITAVPLLEAQRLGYRYSVLQASELGYPIYQRLGYRHVWDLRLFH